MNYYMLRSFDHSGYYETRTILMLAALAVAGYFLFARGDWRYLIIFVSGVAFQALLEWRIQSAGLRGINYNLSVFSMSLSGWPAFLFQGCAEGGILAMMSFWFADLFTGNSFALSRNAYLAASALIVAFAFLVGYLSIGQPISSPRPMLRSGIMGLGLVIIASLILMWLTGGLRQLGIYYIGCLVYVFLTFEPLQIMHARYIGMPSAGGGFEAASLGPQIVLMAYSHFLEVAGGKIHYFAVPFALGLVRLGPSG